MAAKTGAGLIPFAVRGGTVYFLFHKTFSGRRAGLLVDFGGGGCKGETLYQTAAREFVEETEAMFLSGGFREIIKPEAHKKSQFRLLQTLLDSTQREHPDWWCERCYPNGRRARTWKTYFVEVEYQELDGMNREWAQDETGRFRKKRELLWVSSQELLDIYGDKREQLWTRLRQLGSARTVIQSIRLCKETASAPASNPAAYKSE